MISQFLSQTYRFALVALLAVALTSCGDDDGDDGGNGGNGSSGDAEAALVITSGAQSLSSEDADGFTYQAQLVYTDGTIETPSGINWSVEDQNVATINSSGTLSAQGTGATIVTATYDLNGTTLTAQAPISISLSSSVFAVSPPAYIGVPGETLPLEPVYFGQGNVSYSYSSSNETAVSVDNGGTMTLNQPGNAVITVTQMNGNQGATVTVPVLVLGEPDAPLPVTRVKVTSSESGPLFKQDTRQFSATAYNSANEEVSAEFSWSTSDNNVITVDDNGMITAQGLGEAKVMATTQGIAGEALVEVYPDTIVVVEPFFASVSQGGSQQFTATVYNARNQTEITGVPVTWEVPTVNIPGFDFLDIGTVDQNGNLTVNANATPGISSIVVAYVNNNMETAGAAQVMVAVGGGGDGPDCSQGDAAIETINITNGTSITLDPFNATHDIEFEALDGSGNPISNPTVVYHSDNMSVANVDSFGTITYGGASGTATVTVCGPNASATITVTVQ